MELPVSFQLRELELALALGAAFALWFCLLGPLRRGRISTAVMDLVYVLTVFLSLLAFALYVGGGRLRLIALGAMAFSGGICLRIAVYFRKKLKNFGKTSKKLLQSRENLVK